MLHRRLWLALALIGCAPAAADDTAACHGPPQPARIAEALPHQNALRLDDGRTVRLADLTLAGPLAADDAPAPAPSGSASASPSGSPSPSPSPSPTPSPEPAATLDALAGAEVLLRPLTGAPIDRHGRTLGTVVMKDTGADLSHALLADGLALVDPAVMSGECLAVLLAAERQAEAAKKGIWAREPVLSALSQDLAAKAGRQALVAGTVRSVGRSRRSIYLNFGADWRSDFTVILSPGTANELAENPAALTGARVRIRGVLEAWNGGLIKVEHPAQVERLDGSLHSR